MGGPLGKGPALRFSGGGRGFISPKPWFLLTGGIFHGGRLGRKEFPTDRILSAVWSAVPGDRPHWARVDSPSVWLSDRRGVQPPVEIGDCLIAQ